MRVYRIGSPVHPLLDGTGAAASDNARWNGPGRYVIYCAEHYATAVLERAAQLNAVRLPRGLVYTAIDVPDDLQTDVIAASDLPGWDHDDRRASQAFGNAWYDAGRSLLLIVPALAAPGLERNVLINQRHPAFPRVVASPPQPVVCHPRLLV